MMETAPFGRRFAAYAIDLVLVTLAINVVTFVGAMICMPLLSHRGSLLVLDPEVGVRLSPDVSPNSLILVGVLILALVFVIGAIYHGYFIWYEFRRAGQTPGKRWLGLRVVDDASGGPLTERQAVVRDFMRYIDVGLLIPGLAAILLDPAKAKRLGDRVARTRVILAGKSTVKEFSENP